MKLREKIPLSIASTLRFFFINAAIITLQIYIKKLGGSSFQIGLLQSALWGGILLFAPFWGALSDITGKRRKILLISTFIAGVLMPLLGVTESVWAVLGTTLLISSFSSGYPPIALAFTSERSSKSDRGRNMSVFNSSKSAGLTSGRILAGVFLAYLTFKQTFWLYSAVGMGTVLALLMLEKTSNLLEGVRKKELLRKSFRKMVPNGLGKLWHKNGHKYLLTSIFIRKASITAVFAMLAVFITSERGLSSTQMGLITGLAPGVQIVLMLVFGKLVDRIGRKKVFSVGFLLCATVPIIYAHSTTFLTFCIGSVVLGTAFSAITAGTTAFIGDIAPEKRQGELLGIRKTVQGLAGVIGGIAGGFLTSIIGYQYMFYTMSGMMLLGSFLALYNTTETIKYQK